MKGSLDGTLPVAGHSGGDAIVCAITKIDATVSKKPSEEELTECSPSLDLLHKYRWCCPPAREADLNRVLKLKAPKPKAKGKAKAKAKAEPTDEAIRSARLMFEG